MLTRRAILLLITIGLPLRAAAQDTTFYSVSYIEVKPSSRSGAIAMLKQYRDITRRDSGNIRLELFEQADRPAHFCLVETWQTAAGFEARAAQRKQLADALEATRISGWDTRPYKTL